MLSYLSTLSHRMLVGICIIMFFIAIADYLYQRFEFLKGLRMTKQEIKDEYKQQEGDPQVKRRLRQVRVERARKRMMAAVPSADVIVTNPTHYSVALKYDAAEMRAPRVVAKGLDNIALRIREVAREHNIRCTKMWHWRKRFTPLWISTKKFPPSIIKQWRKSLHMFTVSRVNLLRPPPGNFWMDRTDCYGYALS